MGCFYFRTACCSDLRDTLLMLNMTLEAWHCFFPLSWIPIRDMMVLFYFPHVTGSPWAYPSTDRLFLRLCLNNSIATHPGVVQTPLLFISSILFWFSSSTSHIYPHLLLCYGFDLNRCGLYSEHFSLWKHNTWLWYWLPLTVGCTL